MAGEDFVMVRLTKRGEEVAGGAPLRISSNRRTFVFETGVAQRVERSFEWRGILSAHVTPQGEHLFELEPETPAATSIEEEEK